MRTNRLWPFALLTALFVAGCGSTDTGSAAPDGEPLIASAPSKPVRSASIPTIEVKAPKPEELIGLDGDGLRKALGTASLVRRDLGSEIWQYKTDACVLFLFLYPDADKTKKPAVHHMDVRGGDMQNCLKTVVLQAKRAAAG